MKVVFNNVLPEKGFIAMTVWPFVFIRKKYKNEDLSVTMNHEKIHAEQQKELLMLGYSMFYIIYAIGHLWRLLKYRDADKAYRQSPFEREAYAHEKDMTYLDRRKHYAQWRKK